jgi:hypothetical protein
MFLIRRNYPPLTDSAPVWPKNNLNGRSDYNMLALGKQAARRINRAGTPGGFVG